MRCSFRMVGRPCSDGEWRAIKPVERPVAPHGTPVVSGYAKRGCCRLSAAMTNTSHVASLRISHNVKQLLEQKSSVLVRMAFSCLTSALQKAHVVMGGRCRFGCPSGQSASSRRSSFVIDFTPVAIAAVVPSPVDEEAVHNEAEYFPVFDVDAGRNAMSRIPTHEVVGTPTNTPRHYPHTGCVHINLMSMCWSTFIIRATLLVYWSIVFV